MQAKFLGRLDLWRVLTVEETRDSTWGRLSGVSAQWWYCRVAVPPCSATKTTKRTTGIRSWYLSIPKHLFMPWRTEWLLEQGTSKDFHLVLDVAGGPESAAVTVSVSNSKTEFIAHEDSLSFW